MFQAIDLDRLQSCTFGRWAPTIGDPTFAGWFTVGAYALCTILALLVLTRVSGDKTRMKGFWLVLCLAMAFLAVNKQLDLQSLLTAVGRCISRQQGWYEDRRAFQRGFIEVLLVLIAMVLAASLYWMRRDLRRNGMALLGLVVVCGFVAVRAVGFHHFDEVINFRVKDVRFNVIFELAGLVLIAVNALILLWRPAPRGP